MNRMKAVLKSAPRPGAEIAAVEVPRPGPGEVLLKVLATSVCGTDLHIFDWDEWARFAIRPPLVFGHEFCGEVVEMGEAAEGLKVGDRVAVESHIPCGSCIQCRAGRRHICDRLQIIGIDRQGCFAEYITMPALCAWKIPSTLAPEIGSIMEPMGNAVHAVHAAGVEGRRIAVFGCGPTGLFTVAVARACGAERIAAVDVNPSRAELARSLGADEVLDGSGEGVAERVARACGEGGADVVFEMSGNPSAIRNGLRAARKGGTFVAFGIASRPVELDLSNEVIMKSRTILGVLGRRMFETWEQMQRLLDSGRLDPRPVITHRFALGDFVKAVETVRNPRERCGKVVLFPS